MSDETKPKVEPTDDDQAPAGGANAGAAAAAFDALEHFTGGEHAPGADPLPPFDGTVEREHPGTGVASEGTEAQEGEIVTLTAVAEGVTETAADPSKVETATAPAPEEKPAPPAWIPPRPAVGDKKPSKASGLVRVRNLTGWGGVDFNFAAGDILDMPAAMAEDRAAAGLVEIL